MQPTHSHLNYLHRATNELLVTSGAVHNFSLYPISDLWFFGGVYVTFDLVIASNWFLSWNKQLRRRVSKHALLPPAIYDNIRGRAPCATAHFAVPLHTLYVTRPT